MPAKKRPAKGPAEASSAQAEPVTVNAFDAAGIYLPDTKPFFKPEGRVKTVTIVSVARPSEEHGTDDSPVAWNEERGRWEKPFLVKNADGVIVNKGKVPLYAVLDVEDQTGQGMSWEVTSVLLARQLRRLFDEVSLPVDVDVSVKGSGTNTRYTVQLAGTAVQSSSARTEPPPLDGLTVDCPDCPAKASKKCRSENGFEIKSHKARVKLAEEARDKLLAAPRQSSISAEA